MSGQAKATDFVKTHIAEAIKQRFVYDGSDRMTDVYSASTDAKHGEACSHTQYEYVGTSGRVEKMKETMSTWDSSWDI